MFDIPSPPNSNRTRSESDVRSLSLPVDRHGGVEVPAPSDRQNLLKLERLLESQKKIRENKSKAISFSQPILLQKEKPVIFPKTINVIQGKAGVHKSRLAETICASLLKKPDSYRDLLHFNTNAVNRYAVCYVDTERNLSDQLPYSLQQIQLKAGFEIEEHPYGFDYISLLEFAREERFEMLNMYLDYIRKKFQMHLFIVLDVITDCVFNFNDTKDSMKLIDMMNQSINRHDVTFLCLIHENPGNTDKARGHLGTEILNKASTVIQIGFEKDSENHNTDLIKVAYLKCRSSRKHDPFYVQYSEEERGLIIAEAETIKLANDSKNHKASLVELIELLPVKLSEPTNRKQLLGELSEELDCTTRTIITRLQYILENNIPLYSTNEKLVYLNKKTEAKEIIYFLVEKPIQNTSEK